MNAIIKLSELLEATPDSMTQIQLDNGIKQFLGKEIEIISIIRDIAYNQLHLATGSSYGLEILFDKNIFDSQLQALGKGDKVIVLAKLTSINSSARYYYFDLTSIKKQPLPLPSTNINANTSSKSKSGCFIATACYGDYNAKEVLVLRQYRDEKLLKTYSGQVFVKFYYLVSPFLASLISKSAVLKQSVRHYFLEPIITKLQKQNKR